MAFPKSRILTTKRFIQLFHETKDKQRFCFILGAGASVDSKIAAGNRLEMIWMDELMGKTQISPGHRLNPDDTKKLAKNLYDEDEIEHNFDQIEKAWEIAHEEAEKKRHELGPEAVIDPTLSSEYYFDLYKLRFHPNPRNGYRYLEQLMDKVTPSLGYHVLALILSKDNRHNLVITTNFDSLTEDALFIYTEKRPLVVGHESLAAYIDSDTNRPIIAKVHRGLMFDPFNSPETTDHLQEEWRKSLDYAFKTYTPIVIGYGGGDSSLMDYLKETELSKGIYWCYMEEFGLPGKEIQRFVRKKNGCFVGIKGFDKLMMELGKDFYPNDIGPDNAAKYLSVQSDRRAAEYLERWIELNNDPNTEQLLDAINKAENVDREKRAESNILTYWDHFNRGYKATQEGDYERAIAEYTEAIKKDPTRPIAYNNRGNQHYRQEKFERAIQDYIVAIALDPKFADAYYNRGNCYTKQSRYERAIQDYDKAIELDPNDAAAYIGRSVSYAKLGQYERAIQGYDKVIDLNLNEALVYVNRGSSYAGLGQHERAILDYDKAIELDPSDALAYNNRAFSNAHIYEFTKAISDVETALSMKPDEPNALHTYGFIYLQQKLYKEAIEYFTKALSFDDELKDAYEDRAKAYRAIGETALAEADEAKVAELEAAEKKDNP